jgi:integrase
MKPQAFLVKPYRNAARPKLKWQVVGNVGGKRRREFFQVESHAKTAAQLRNKDLFEYGAEATQVPGPLRLMAKRCQDQLAPFKWTIQDATKLALRSLKEHARSCTIESVFEQLTEEQKARGLTKHYASQFRWLSKRLSKMFPNRVISELTTRDLEEFLTKAYDEKAAPASRNQRHRMLVTVWKYGKKHGYCSADVAINIAWAKDIEKAIGILQPDQLAKIFAVASPKILPALAIGAFAGLRTSELCKLDWNEIDLREIDLKTGGCGFITVPAAKAKSARRRVVKILPCLAAWLRPFEKSSGPVSPTKSDQYFCELRQQVAAKAGISWLKNALRHSFASYHHGAFGEAEKLASEMGHTSNDLIYSNYRELVRPDRAEKYWQVTPFSRPELKQIYAFTPQAYPWYFKSGRVVVDGDWIDGVKNMAHYFGVDQALPYYWFNHVVAAPPRPTDDRFRVSTWREFVKNHTHVTSELEPPLFYVSWYCGSGRQMREFFATEGEATENAERRNREQLAKELHLDQIANVIEFPSGDTVESLLRLQTTGSASIGGLS